MRSDEGRRMRNEERGKKFGIRDDRKRMRSNGRGMRIERKMNED